MDPDPHYDDADPQPWLASEVWIGTQEVSIAKKNAENISA
jgi:hypothetical protein